MSAEGTPRELGSMLSWVSIFTSAGTLVCCALPAALVAVGAGASLVGLLGAFPQLIWLSENKAAVFGIAAVMLALAGIAQHRARLAPCPADARLAEECRRARAWSRRLYFVSLALFAVGAFFAFLAPLFD